MGNAQQKIVSVKAINMDEKLVLKMAQEAYRQGLRDAENTSDIKPLLILSQAAAYQIYENLGEDPRASDGG